MTEQQGFRAATEGEVRELLGLLPDLPSSGLNLMNLWITVSEAYEDWSPIPESAERIIEVLKCRINDAR